MLEQTVIHTERETTVVEDHQTTTNHPAPAPKVVVNTVQAPVKPAPAAKPAKTPCGVFILPNAGKMPLKPDIANAEDIDKAMSDYVKALRQHIESERKSIVGAYDTHLKKCDE